MKRKRYTEPQIVFALQQLAQLVSCQRSLDPCWEAACPPPGRSRIATGAGAPAGVWVQDFRGTPLGASARTDHRP